MKQQQKTMRTLFCVVAYFIIESFALIASDIAQRIYYSEEFRCHLPFFQAYSAAYGAYWIISRFISNISANLIALCLLWRPRIKVVQMDQQDYEVM